MWERFKLVNIRGRMTIYDKPLRMEIGIIITIRGFQMLLATRKLLRRFINNDTKMFEMID
jgi:hypothetical protein